MEFEKKISAGGALFLNDAGEILVVKPSYKEGWEIPGGITEKGESPRAACERELKEEIGLERQITKLLCVDYKNQNNKESYQFVFDGGVIATDQIQIDGKEIIDFKFVASEDLSQFLSESLARRVLAILESGRKETLYLENGHWP